MNNNTNDSYLLRRYDKEDYVDAVFPKIIEHLLTISGQIDKRSESALAEFLRIMDSESPFDILEFVPSLSEVMPQEHDRLFEESFIDNKVTDVITKAEREVTSMFEEQLSGNPTMTKHFKTVTKSTKPPYRSIANDLAEATLAFEEDAIQCLRQALETVKSNISEYIQKQKGSAIMRSNNTIKNIYRKIATVTELTKSEIDVAENVDDISKSLGSMLRSVYIHSEPLPDNGYKSIDAHLTVIHSIKEMINDDPIELDLESTKDECKIALDTFQRNVNRIMSSTKAAAGLLPRYKFNIGQKVFIKSWGRHGEVVKMGLEGGNGRQYYLVKVNGVRKPIRYTRRELTKAI